MNMRNYNTLVLLLKEEKTQLLAEQKKLLNKLSEGEWQNVAGPGKEIMDCTLANSIEAQRVEKLKKLEGTLEAIDYALNNLAFGEFGICKRCEEPIGVKRLLAIPYARFCLACQGAVDQSGFAAVKVV